MVRHLESRSVTFSEAAEMMFQVRDVVTHQELQRYGICAGDTALMMENAGWDKTDDVGEMHIIRGPQLQQFGPGPVLISL